MYKQIQRAWKKPSKEMVKERLIQWRREPAVLKLDNPTRPDRARSLGYKAKQGVIVSRVRVIRGGRQRALIKKARKPTKRRRKLILDQNYRSVSEQRAQKYFKNLEILNSYYVLKDGRYYWYEVILVDPNHSRIKTDKRLNWIGKKANKKRVSRGLTSAARKSRGLRHKGKGSEKARKTYNKKARKKS